MNQLGVAKKDEGGLLVKVDGHRAGSAIILGASSALTSVVGPKLGLPGSLQLQKPSPDAVAFRCSAPAGPSLALAVRVEPSVSLRTADKDINADMHIEEEGAPR